MSLISTDPFYSPPLDAPPIDFPSLTFEVLHQDELCARVHVDFNTRVVQLEQYTDDFIKRPFYQEHVTVEDVLNFFEDRCFPRTRANADQLLADLGLSIYDPQASSSALMACCMGSADREQDWICVLTFSLYGVFVLQLLLIPMHGVL